MRRIAVLTTLLLAACAAPPPGPEPIAETPATEGFHIPVYYHKLENGLRVVISPDTSVPTATVAVYYEIGFRSEPRGRTGFAHLFEHMMFQGSSNLGKMEFVKLIQGNGGVMNGSTRFDFTNYYAAVPAHKLETVLWAEADRMSGLAIDEDNLVNQKGVVKNEVKVNVLNRPYGGFPWLDLPQHANQNWHNAHNFYGDLDDLDAATLEDVRKFFDIYYAPNNAALVVAGDVDPDAALALVKKYFDQIPSARQVAPPDISEPRQTEERRASRSDELAPKPAIALAYHMPERGTPEYFAMGVIDQILVQGRDSHLFQRFVTDTGITDSIMGGINLLGNMYNYSGPMIWTVALIHEPEHGEQEIVKIVDDAVQRLVETPLSDDEIEQALIKMRSSFYSLAGSSTRFGLTDLLASFALFDDDPHRINRLEEEFRQVTPELIQATAREYLRMGNRTVLVVEPGAQGGRDES